MGSFIRKSREIRMFCVTILILELIRFAESFYQKVDNIELHQIILDMRPEIDPERLAAILKCTLLTRSIQRSLECEKTINEILLRKQWRTYDEDCTAIDEDNKLLLSSPLEEIKIHLGSEPPVLEFKHDQEEMDRKYIAWQDRLIDSGKIFCDPFKHLYCGPNNKCQCWSTLDEDIDPLSPGRFDCIAKEGSYCYPPDIPFPSRFFDPFTKDQIEVEVPKCYDSTRAVGKCNSELGFFSADVCEELGDDTLYQKADLEFENHFFNATPLKFGDQCNFDHFKLLTENPESEWRNLKLRVDALTSFIAGQAKFCDAGYICEENSLKCECQSPTIWTPDPMETRRGYCGIASPDEFCKFSDSVDEKIATMPKNYKIWLTYFYKHNAGKVACSLSENKTCHHDSNLYPEPFCKRMESYYIGKMNTPLSKFFPKYSHHLLPSDVTDIDARRDVFINFNKVATQFEQFFKLGEGEPCSVTSDVELKSRELIDRIESLSEMSSVTQTNYADLTIDITTFINNNIGTTFCQTALNRREYEEIWTPKNARSMHFLTCIPNPDPKATTSGTGNVCSVIWNKEYLYSLVEGLGDIYTLDRNETCELDIKDAIEDALQKEKENEFNTEEETFDDLFGLVDFYLADKTQFCNKTAKLQCTFTSAGDPAGICLDVVEVSTTEEPELWPDITNRPKPTSASGSQFIDSMLFCILLIFVCVDAMLY